MGAIFEGGLKKPLLFFSTEKLILRRVVDHARDGFFLRS